MVDLWFLAYNFCYRLRTSIKYNYIFRLKDAGVIDVRKTQEANLINKVKRYVSLAMTAITW